MGRQPDPRPAQWLAGGAFGSSDARWHATPDDDPAEVAAAWLQHRLLRRIAERMGTDEVAAAELARRIGRPERSTYRAVRGERPVSLGELMAWAGAVGLELFQDFPESVAELLPPDVPALVPNWRPGAGQPMRFVRRSNISEVEWGGVATQLAAWLAAAKANGTVQFVAPRVVLHAVVTDLFRRGVPPGVAHPGSPEGTHAEVWFDDPQPAVLVTEVDLGDPASREAALAATRRAIGAAFAAAQHDADTRLVCLVLSRRAKERLDGYVEQIGGGWIQLPFERLRSLPDGDKFAATLTGHALGQMETADGAVLVWSVEKPDVVA